MVDLKTVSLVVCHVCHTAGTDGIGSLDTAGVPQGGEATPGFQHGGRGDPAVTAFLCSVPEALGSHGGSPGADVAGQLHVGVGSREGGDTRPPHLGPVPPAALTLPTKDPPPACPHSSLKGSSLQSSRRCAHCQHDCSRPRASSPRVPDGHKPSRAPPCCWNYWPGLPEGLVGVLGKDFDVLARGRDALGSGSLGDSAWVLSSGFCKVARVTRTCAAGGAGRRRGKESSWFPPPRFSLC